MSRRVLVALDVTDEQASDVDDLLVSVQARLQDEAGYLRSGEPVTPTEVVVAVVDLGNDDEPLVPLTSESLNGVYEVGIEGVEALFAQADRELAALRAKPSPWTCEECGVVVPAEQADPQVEHPGSLVFCAEHRLCPGQGPFVCSRLFGHDGDCDLASG